MAVSIPRLRIWFGVMALAVAVVAAGFYLYARRLQYVALKNLPAKIGVDIQQSSEGFTFTKSEGNRTLFSIHASKVLQYKAGGRAHLQDVNIIVYGRDGKRFDQIYGNDFDYDPEAGTVAARGEVNIDLEGNDASGEAGQAVPREVRNPIHLKLAGLTFNQKTGQAETDGAVEFRVPQASGTAHGARYSTKDNSLQLLSAVDVQTGGAQATRIQAASGLFTKEPRVLVLDRAEMASETYNIAADHATLDMAEDNALQAVHAAGNVRLAEPKGGMEVRSPRAELKLGAKNTLETSRFLDGVELMASAQGTSGHAGEMLLHFAPARAARGAKQEQAQLQTIDAMHGVTLRRAAPPKGENPQDTAIASDAMTFHVQDGHVLTSAETLAQGQLIMSSTAARHKGEQTVIDAQHFTADFGERNQLKTVHGTGAVKVTSRAPNAPDRVSTSAAIVAEFNPSGDLSHVVQTGQFRYREASHSANEPGGRAFFAERASYSPQDDSLTMTGAPRLVDGGMTVTADSIRMLRATGEAFAQGNVKSTYSELKVQPDGALLATSDPVHVTAHAMNAVQMSGLAHYSGNARLWQGANIVEGQTIDFDQKARTIVASGDRHRLVTSLFTHVDSKGAVSTMLVTAPHLEYVDRTRRAVYSGGVTAQSEGGVMTAGQADVFLNAAGSARANGPSQLERIVATSRVVLQQQERRAQGEHLVYTAATGTYVMTGGSPVLSDPVNGTVRGDSLTFFSRDDRVVVEGKDGSRTVTHTHVSR
ncbi:MAG: LptA/OstA family protein [Acidobacteriota bacterium]|nr:LptA/OstA family protein [Acidobacteriota bacterium]